MQTQPAADLTMATDIQKSEIELIVLDIDGTIAGHSNQISEPVKQAIAAAQAQGVKVAIATGRMFCSALRFHQEIASNLPLIAYQGALIKDPQTQQVLFDLRINRQIALEVLDYLEKSEWRPALSIHCYLDDRLYVRELTHATLAYGERTGVKPLPVGDLREFLTSEPTKILALCEDPTVTDTLLGSLRSLYTPAELYLTKSVATFFEVTHPAVNKGAAVRYLAEKVLDIPLSRVMTVGDNFNDVEMLEVAGIAVAMGNAPAEVKAIASWVAPPVELDGVAAAIQKFVL